MVDVSLGEVQQSSRVHSHGQDMEKGSLGFFERRELRDRDN